MEDDGPPIIDETLTSVIALEVTTSYEDWRKRKKMTVGAPHVVKSEGRMSLMPRRDGNADGNRQTVRIQPDRRQKHPTVCASLHLRTGQRSKYFE